MTARKSVLRPIDEVKKNLVREMYRRGGRVHVGTKDRPGEDREVFDIIAANLGVTEEEKHLTLADIYPRVLTWKNGTSEGKRNAWLKTLLVAVQKLRDNDKSVLESERGYWELTVSGMRYGEKLTSEGK